MRKPLIFSSLFHAVILAVVLISFNLWPPEPIVSSEPVIMVTPDMLIAENAIPKPAEEPKPEPPKPEEKPPAEKAPEPEPEQSSPTPPRVEEAEEAPPPEPAPTPEPKPEPPKPKNVTKDLPNVTPRDKPKPPKKFDVAAIEKLLLNKTDNTAPQTKDKPPKKQTDPDPSRAQDTSRNPMEQARATANIQSLIATQIARCWTAPVGATGAETLVVRIRIYLRRDGSLEDEPIIVDRGRMMSDNLYRVAAEAAKRAVQRCAPLRLPSDYYDLWRDVQLNFDPSKML